jgi:hypothetical protein
MTRSRVDATCRPNEHLDAYLSNKVFTGDKSTTIAPDQEDVDGFAVFMEHYKEGLAIERTAVNAVRLARISESTFNAAQRFLGNLSNQTRLSAFRISGQRNRLLMTGLAGPFARNA